MTMTDVGKPKKPYVKTTLGKGYSRSVIARKLLRREGVYGINKDNIRYDFYPLNGGIGLKAIVYGLDIFDTSRSTELPTLSLVVKDRIPGRGIDLFEDIQEERGPVKDAQFEHRLLKFFLTFTTVPRVIDYNYNKARIIMERWGGSLDKLLLKQMNEPNPKIKELERDYPAKYLERVVFILGENSKKATENMDLLQEVRARVPPISTSNMDVYIKKFEKFLIGIARSCAKENSPNKQNGIDSLISNWESKYLKGADEDLRILASYISGKSQESINAVIHFDARSQNVLYRIQDHNINGWEPNIELTMCDFASVRLGPLAYDFATAVNDFHLVKCGDIRLEQAIILFNDVMLHYSELWTPEKDRSKKVEQLEKEFVFSSFVDAIIKTGVPSLLKEENPEVYNLSLTNGVDTAENKIKVKFDRLNEILKLHRNVHRFNSLIEAIRSARELGS